MSLPVGVPTKFDDLGLQQLFAQIIRRSVDGTTFPLFVGSQTFRVGVGTITPWDAFWVQSTSSFNAKATFYAGVLVEGGLNVTQDAMVARTLSAGSLFVAGNADFGALRCQNLPIYANNAAAVAGGLRPGQFYRTGADPDPVCVVH